MKNKEIRMLTPEERAAAKLKIRGENSVKTICQLLRDLYVLAEKRNDGVSCSKLIDAYCYAKRMNRALRARDGNYDLGWWSKEEIHDTAIPEVPETADKSSG